jgi:hypothetical protein
MIHRAPEQADHRGAEKRQTGNATGNPRSAGTEAMESTLQDEAGKSVIARYPLRAKGGY